MRTEEAIRPVRDSSIERNLTAEHRRVYNRQRLTYYRHSMQHAMSRQGLAKSSIHPPVSASITPSIHPSIHPSRPASRNAPFSRSAISALSLSSKNLMRSCPSCIRKTPACVCMGGVQGRSAVGLPGTESFGSDASASAPQQPVRACVRACM